MLNLDDANNNEDIDESQQSNLANKSNDNDKVGKKDNKEEDNVEKEDDKDFQEKVDLSEELNDSVDEKIDTLNEDIDKTNDESRDSVKQHNKLLKQIKETQTKAIGKISDIIKDDLHDLAANVKMMERQFAIQSEQQSAQNRGQEGQSVIQSLRQKAQELSQQEQNGNNNPLIDSGYLMRISGYIEKTLQREQETMNAGLQVEQAELQGFKKQNDAEVMAREQGKQMSKMQAADAVKKMRNDQDKLNKKIKEINNKIDDFADKETEINDLYDKYYDEIWENKNADAVDNFNNDVDEILCDINSGNYKKGKSK